MTERVRVAVIGAGRIGRHHARTIATQIPGVELAALVDADESVVREAAAAVRCDRWTTAPAEVLDDRSVQAVVIASPTGSHASLVMEAAAAGKDIFCEKPIALSLEETDAALDAVSNSGVRLQVGFQRRFDPGYRAARDLVGSGELGWIHSVWACTYDQAPPHAAYIPTSGGIFRDCSVHDFDIVRWVTGREVVTVYAQGANRGAAFFAEAGDVDTGSAVLELDDGTQVLLGATRYNGAGHDVRMEVHGSAGSVAVGLDDATPLRSAEAGVGWPGGTAYQHFTQRFAVGYRAELVAFCEVAAGRAPSPCSGEDALAALLIANAAEESRRTRRRVTVDRTPSVEVPA